MPKYLIELRHDPEELKCARVVKYFLTSGSHLLTHADWGCLDGEHSAWLIVDVNSKDEARLTVPVPFRPEARIVALNKWSVDEIDEIIRRHAK
jgi:hypothetical protein